MLPLTEHAGEWRLYTEGIFYCNRALLQVNIRMTIFLRQGEYHFRFDLKWHSETSIHQSDPLLTGLLNINGSSHYHGKLASDVTHSDTAREEYAWEPGAHIQEVWRCVSEEEGKTEQLVR